MNGLSTQYVEGLLNIINYDALKVLYTVIENTFLLQIEKNLHSKCNGQSVLKGQNHFITFYFTVFIFKEPLQVTTLLASKSILGTLFLSDFVLFLY